VVGARALPNVPALKHLYSLVIGFSFGLFCFGSGMVHSLITAVLTYLIVGYGGGSVWPRDPLRQPTDAAPSPGAPVATTASLVPGSLAPKLVFAVTLGHLSLSHIYRQITNYGGYELDYTGPQMVLVIKLTSFAYNVYDGTRQGPVRRVRRSGGRNAKRLTLGSAQRVCVCVCVCARARVPNEQIHKDLQARAIKRIPNLLEYFGFVYFFGSFLAGPAHEYLEYQQMTDLTLFEAVRLQPRHRRRSALCDRSTAAMPFPSRLPNAPQDAQGRRKVPPTYLPALKALFTGVLCFVGIHLSGMYPVAWMATAEFLSNTTFWYRFGYLQLSCTLQRFMYYFVWTIAEGACIAAGLGYNGRGADGKTIQWCAAGHTHRFRPGGRDAR